MKEVVRTLIVNATKPGHIAVTAFVNVPDKVSSANICILLSVRFIVLRLMETFFYRVLYKASRG